jgi:hypothetical protein
MCALIFMESFDGYATAHLTQGRWNSTTIGTAGVLAVQAGTGRYGTQSLRMTHTTSAPGVLIFTRKTFAASATWIVGWAYRTSSLSVPRDVLSLREAGVSQVDVVVGVDGTVAVTRGGTVLGTTSPGAITVTAGAYTFFELRAVIGSAGSVQLRLNSQVLLSVSGVNTQVSANPWASELVLGNLRLPMPGTVDSDFDDLYVLDGTGAAPHNAFLGDCRVICLVPIGQELAEFTPSAGTNWDAVNEIPPSSTDYTEAQTVGSRDRFQYQALPSLVNPVIYGVQMSLYCTNPDTGPRQIAAHAISGTQEIDGVGQALPGVYTYLQDRFARDPQGALWTPASLAAGRFGYKIVA